MDAFQTEECVSWAPVGIWVCLYGGRLAHWQAKSQVARNIIKSLKFSACALFAQGLLAHSHQLICWDLRDARTTFFP